VGSSGGVRRKIGGGREPLEGKHGRTLKMSVLERRDGRGKKNASGQGLKSSKKGQQTSAWCGSGGG